MKKIIFDILGNDNGIGPALEATIEFSKLNDDYKIILVGEEKEILKNNEIKELENNKKIEILDISLVVDKKNSEIQNLKLDNSTNLSLKILKDKKADALISSCDSAFLLVSSMYHLKKIDNIERAAFMPIFPTIIENKRYLMLDVGANLSIKPQHMVQWAKAANIISKEVLNVSNPLIHILNIGTEDTKGFEYHIEANKLLKKEKELNYKGFIEPRNLFNGETDIVLTDGYAGNMCLKSMEGTVLSLVTLLKKSLTKNIGRKLATSFLKKAFYEFKEKLDYRNVGSALILGVNGLVLKSHGSSGKKEYLGALNQVKEHIEKDTINKIKKELNENSQK